MRSTDVQITWTKMKLGQVEDSLMSSCQTTVLCCIQFIHSGYFYSASSSPLLLRGAPDIALILCHAEAPQATEGLAKGQLERDSNLQPFGRNKPPHPHISI